MKIVDTMPQNGAFVMVLEWDDELHSDSFKYIDNVLHVWDIPDMDTSLSEWIEVNLSDYYHRCVFEECNVKYIVK
ncbi:hypothetical protein [Aeromonas phage AS-yj]|uniref:Uncharacterized protein n=4 Tax=Ceceduovirus TaxID=2842588 RepID=A0A291LDY4_9CAUD|nr:hypothetical protein HWB28_gp209 [Aeromonas phage AS-zj]YP_009834733.1 hypothetical protein HWB29_gp031 [Aeromonas phage AS-sw]ATI17244.1 hypothetical protein [Aeromonas phage AS-szw]ATI17854.1 hypothetical protein [Aeromonas phage AS-yj]QAX98868.1 hypothetical protein assk_69 [Aeromonas phage Assk]QMV28879.1 hypothetical protein AP1_0172 [Aeromonas phage AP1]ASU00343.1 hypothetical protein [Aeromonas phage AS-zj]